MKRVFAFLSLLWLMLGHLGAQPVIPSTAYTRTLLRATNAAQADAILGFPIVSGSVQFTNATIYSPNTNRAALEVWPTLLENVANNTNSGKPITLGTNVNTGSGDWINIPAVVTDMNRANEARSGIMWDPPTAAGSSRAQIRFLPFHSQNGPAPNGYANNSELAIISPGSIHLYNGDAGAGGYCMIGGTGLDGTSATLQYSAGGDQAGGVFSGKGHSAHLSFVARYYNGGVQSGTAEMVFEAVDTAGDTRLNFYLPADTTYVSDGTWKGQGTLILGIKTNGLVVGAASITTNGVFTGDGSGLTNANGWRTMIVTGSDSTTTGQALTDVTGLTSALAVSSVYRFKATLLCSTTAVTTGTEYGVANTGATASVGMTTFFTAAGFTNAAGVGPGAVYTVGATNTATPPFLLGSGQTGVVILEGFITTAGGPPTMAIRHLKVTSGTSTILQGSTLELLKVK